MKMSNVHERTFDATPEQLAAIVQDFDRIWPTEIARAPTPQGDASTNWLHIWQEYDKPGAARHVPSRQSDDLQAEALVFDVEAWRYASASHDRRRAMRRRRVVHWRDRIEPGHDVVLEKLLDNVGETVA